MFGNLLICDRKGEQGRSELVKKKRGICNCFVVPYYSLFYFFTSISIFFFYSFFVVSYTVKEKRGYSSFPRLIFLLLYILNHCSYFYFTFPSPFLMPFRYPRVSPPVTLIFHYFPSIFYSGRCNCLVCLLNNTF